MRRGRYKPFYGMIGDMDLTEQIKTIAQQSGQKDTAEKLLEHRESLQ